MSVKVTVSVEGLRELGERMVGLAQKANGRAASAATSAAARPVKARTIANIRGHPSVDTGSLVGSVIVKKIPKSQTDLSSEHIVTFRGRGKPYNKKGQKIDRAPHAHLIEFGTIYITPEPSLRPAFESEKGNSLTAMTETLERRLIKEHDKK